MNAETMFLPNWKEERTRRT